MWWCSEIQSHRVIHVGRDLRRLFVPAPSSNQIQQEQVAQEVLIISRMETLQPLWKPEVQVFCYPHSEILFSIYIFFSSRVVTCVQCIWLYCCASPRSSSGFPIVYHCKYCERVWKTSSVKCFFPQHRRLMRWE